MEVRWPGSPRRAQAAVISSFKSWGSDVMRFLKVRVTLSFAALSKRWQKREKSSEPQLPPASSRNCGEREEAKLISPSGWSVWRVHVYTAAEKEVSDLLRPLTFATAREKGNDDRKTRTAPHIQHADDWDNNEWKRVQQAPTDCPRPPQTPCSAQVCELMIWPDQVSCFVPGFRCVIFTSTACTFRFLGGTRLTLYVTSSPSTGTYSPSMLKGKPGRAVRKLYFWNIFGKEEPTFMTFDSVGKKTGSYLVLKKWNQKTPDISVYICLSVCWGKKKKNRQRNWSTHC